MATPLTITSINYDYIPGVDSQRHIWLKAEDVPCNTIKVGSDISLLFYQPPHNNLKPYINHFKHFLVTDINGRKIWVKDEFESGKKLSKDHHNSRRWSYDILGMVIFS